MYDLTSFPNLFTPKTWLKRLAAHVLNLTDKLAVFESGGVAIVCRAVH